MVTSTLDRHPSSAKSTFLKISRLFVSTTKPKAGGEFQNDVPAKGRTARETTYKGTSSGNLDAFGVDDPAHRSLPSSSVHSSSHSSSLPVSPQTSRSTISQGSVRESAHGTRHHSFSEQTTPTISVTPAAPSQAPAISNALPSDEDILYMDAKPTSRHRRAHHHTGGTDSSTKRRSRALSSPPLPPYSIGSPNGSILSLTGSTLIDNVQSSSANRTVSSNSASVSRATSLHRKVPSRKNQESVIVPSRFSLKTDGAHEHHLRVMKRQEKLGQVLKDLLGGKKLRNQAVSAVPNILSSTNLEELDREAQEKEDASANRGRSKPPTLLASLFDQVQNGEVTAYTHRGESLEQPKNTVSVNRGASASLKSISFFDRYGTCQEVIGRGSFGVVRVAHKKVSENGNFVEKLFAVKEFKKRTGESEEKYSKRLTNEFCISSSLKHSGLIDAFDLLRDAKGDYCEVMEYCSGGDLYSLIISAGRLEPAEADCFFKQLIRAVHYMHEIGVAHRDLKPENLLLTADGTVKITDFGNAECFRMAWEDDIQLSRGVCGSSPYIAPEEYVEDEFDPRPLDVWACGVIYMAMRTGRQMWKAARVEDEFYSVYLAKRKDAKGYEPIEALKRVRCRNVVYSILDPIAERRITTLQILNSEWMRQIVCCKRPKLSEAKGKLCGDKS